MTTDRRRLEAMTRDELVREARRVGVTDPEDLERMELVDEILALEPKTPSALALSFLSKAKGFVEQAVVVARSLYEEGKRPSDPPRPASPPATDPAADAVPAATPVPAAAAAPVPAPVPVPVPAAAAAAAPVPVPAPAAAETTGTGTGTETETETETDSDTAMAPAPVIATSTLASVYESQGLLAEAADLYEEVLSRDPSDAAARAGLLRLRPPTPAPTRLVPPPSLESMTLAALDPATLHASWDVSETGVSRAAALVGAPGRLVLRLFGSHPAGGIVATTSHDEEVSARQGEWFFRRVRPASVYHAAVGLFAEGRFVPVAKAGPARTPAGGPSVDVTVEMAEWVVVEPETPSAPATMVPRRVPAERRAGPPARESRLAPSSRLR